MNVDLELKPIDREDLPKLRRWRNDWRIIAWTRQFDMLNEVEHAAWFERQAVDPTLRMYKIVMKAAGQTEPVGVCGLTSIDWRCRRAEFSCYIGPEFHRRGIGKNALAILLTHGFENLGLNLIWGETFASNPAAKMFESLGFVKEGTRRQFYLKDGKLIDAHLYSITAEEWHVRRNRKPDSERPDAGAGASDHVEKQASGLVVSPRAGAEAVLDAEVVPAEGDGGAPKADRKRRRPTLAERAGGAEK